MLALSTLLASSQYHSLVQAAYVIPNTSCEEGAPVRQGGVSRGVGSGGALPVHKQLLLLPVHCVLFLLCCVVCDIIHHMHAQLQAEWSISRHRAGETRLEPGQTPTAVSFPVQVYCFGVLLSCTNLYICYIPQRSLAFEYDATCRCCSQMQH